MVSKSAILVVEDDENLRVALRDNLEDEGYAVADAVDVAAALTAVARTRFDLIILDIMLPDGDGYSLCKRLRADGHRSLILMLTARTLEEDMVSGLDAGADDYMVKPYRLRELLARVRALLRRGDSAGNTAASPADELCCGEYRIDLRAREIFAASGKSVTVTRTEFDLLCYFVRHAGRAIAREELLAEVWGKGVVVDDHTVDNFVSSLKKKLRWSEKSRFAIRTVRGVGYRMELEP